MQFYFACTDKADCCAFCNIKKFQLMMPVPVDTVKIKLPDILRIICKRITFTAMLNKAFEAAQKLQAIPKNANPIRLHNRCKLTGRPKGYMRQFGISRIQFREMASSGLIPGVKKASW